MNDDPPPKNEWKKFLGFYPQTRRATAEQQKKMIMKKTAVDNGMDKLHGDIKRAIKALNEQSNQRHKILASLAKEDLSEDEAEAVKRLIEDYINSIEFQDATLESGYETIRFQLSGRWSAKEVVQTLSHFEDLYNFQLAHQKINDFHLDIPMIKNNLVYDFDQIIEPNEQLQVLHVDLKVPGFIEVAGIFPFVGYIRDFVSKIFELISSPEWVGQEKRIALVENAKKLIFADRDLAIPDTEILPTINWVDFRQRTFIELIEQGKITSVVTRRT